MPAPGPRAALLRLAAALAQPTADESPASLTVIIKAPGSRLVITATAAELAELASDSLTPMEEAILTALDEGTMEGPDLAERAGYPNTSRFRAACSHLVKLGRITSTDDGYALVT